MPNIKYDKNKGTWVVNGKEETPERLTDGLRFSDGSTLSAGKLLEIDPEIADKWLGAGGIRPSRPSAPGQSTVSKLIENLPEGVRDVVAKPGVTLGALGAFAGPVGAIAGSLGGNAAEQVYNTGQIEPLQLGTQTALDLSGLALGDIPIRLLAKKLGPRISRSYTPGTGLFSKEAKEAAPTLKQKAIAYLGGKMRNTTAEDIAPFYEKVPGTTSTYFQTLEPTVGQTTGSKALQFIEDAVTGRGFRDVAAEQKIKIGDLISHFRGQWLGTGSIPSRIPQEYYGTSIVKGVKEGRQALKDQQKVIWRRIEGALDKDTTTLDVVVGTEPILAPNGKALTDATGNMLTKEVVEPTTFKALIPIENTTNLLSKYRTRINGMFSDINLQNIPSHLAAKYGLVKNSIDNLLGTTLVKNGEDTVELSAKELSKVQTAKTQIGRILFNKSKADWTDDERILGEIYDSLNNDIETGLGAIGAKQNKDLISDYALTTELRKKQGDVYNPTVMRWVWKNRSEDAYSQDLIPKVWNHAQKTEQLLNSTPPDQHPIIKGAFFDRAVQESTNDATGTFDASIFNNIISNENFGFRKAFTPEEMKQLKDFARAVGHVSQPYSQAGRTAFEIRKDSLLLTAASGAVSSAMQGRPTSGLISGATGSTIIFAAKDFAKALLDPKIGKLAIELAKIDPTSDKAKLLTRSLLYSMRGTRIMFGTNPAFLHPGYIGQEGQIQVDTSYDNSDTNQNTSMTETP